MNLRPPWDRRLSGALLFIAGAILLVWLGAWPDLLAGSDEPAHLGQNPTPSLSPWAFEGWKGQAFYVDPWFYSFLYPLIGVAFAAVGVRFLMGPSRRSDV